MQVDKILVLDFGSQYTQLIARNLREVGVYSEIYAFDAAQEAIKSFNPKGIILSGGPQTLTNDDAPGLPAMVLQLNVPVLGICYGMQLIAAEFGGNVHTSEHKEYGHAALNIDSNHPQTAGLFSGIDTKHLDVWMSHADKVSKLPSDFLCLGSTDNAENAFIAHRDNPIYGVQFHPEVTHTAHGKKIIENFSTKICGCEAKWTTENIIADEITQIKQKVGNDQVILGLSGGVDSAVTAALLHHAIGDQLQCIFVDHGLLRLNEAEEVMATFNNNMGIKVSCIDAKDQFINALKGVDDPEAKRKIIGKQFIDVFESQAKRFQNAKWLAQGTIYPDVIESAGAATGKAKVIKSHHNVGGLPKEMGLKILEPLRMLFKDEVRKMGVELGLAPEMVYRHPFPGPGLAVRILGEIKAEFIQPLQKADAIFIEALRKHDLYDSVSQAFAVFLPIRSVGVVGDNRAYDYVIALRAVETIDFMTAKWSHLPYEFLSEVSHNIINRVEGISRVVYDISGKPPATIEWE